MTFYDVIYEIWSDTGILNFTIGQVIMILASLGLIYLAIKKEFEPLLLLPIGFGGILANIPLAEIAATSTTVLVPGTQEIITQVGGFIGQIYEIGRASCKERVCTLV